MLIKLTGTLDNVDSYPMANISSQDQSFQCALWEKSSTIALLTMYWQSLKLLCSQLNTTVGSDSVANECSLSYQKNLSSIFPTDFVWPAISDGVA